MLSLCDSCLLCDSDVVCRPCLQVGRFAPVAGRSALLYPHCVFLVLAVKDSSTWSSGRCISQRPMKHWTSMFDFLLGFVKSHLRTVCSFWTCSDEFSTRKIWYLNTILFKFYFKILILHLVAIFILFQLSYFKYLNVITLIKLHRKFYITCCVHQLENK